MSGLVIGFRNKRIVGQTTSKQKPSGVVHASVLNTFASHAENPTGALRLCDQGGPHQRVSGIERNEGKSKSIRQPL